MVHQTEEQATYEFLCQKILGKHFTSCPICHGLGYFYQENQEYLGQRDFHIHGNYLLCPCVKKNCSITKQGACPTQPPYEYYDEKERIMRPCQCKPSRQRLDKIRYYLKRSHIPLKYQGKFLHHFETKDDENLTLAVDLANETILKFKQLNWASHGLYLHGETGCGKTLLSCILLNELLRFYACKVNYAKISRDILGKLRYTYNPNSTTYGEGLKIEKELARTDILVIDDFGIHKDKETPWVQNVLYDLIDARYENKKCTIITSNDPMTELKEKGNIRIYSRLREMCREVQIKSQDYRIEHKGVVYD